MGAEGDDAVWMPPLEDSWKGPVEFHELLFGLWTSYPFLVWWWQRVLKAPLPEWRYAMLAFFAAGAFWVNHYFLKMPSPGWLVLINLYTVLFLAVWWLVGMRGRGRGALWTLLAFVGAVAYGVVYILFEQLARKGVTQWGMHEFCWMALSFVGIPALIAWRGRAST